jgi:hypothetical protein
MLDMTVAKEVKKFHTYAFHKDKVQMRDISKEKMNKLSQIIYTWRMKVLPSIKKNLQKIKLYKAKDHLKILLPITMCNKIYQYFRIKIYLLKIKEY